MDGTQYGIKVLSPDRKIDVLGEEHGFRKSDHSGHAGRSIIMKSGLLRLMHCIR